MSSQGLTLNYLDWGNEGAPWLFLVHGNGDHARSWDWTARALRHDFHVVALDLRGHGDSQWSPDGAYSTAYHLLDLINLIEALKAEDVTIVAHSFGGALGVRYAALYPERVRKLAIVDGLGPAPHYAAQWLKDGMLNRTRVWIDKRRDLAQRPLKRFNSIEEAAARLQKDNKRLPDAFARHLALYGVRRDGEAYVWKRDPLVSAFTPEDFLLENDETRAQVAAPVLLFYGPESWTTHPDEDGRARCLRDHRTIVFEETGHWLHHDRFEDFIAELKAFL